MADEGVRQDLLNYYQQDFSKHAATTLVPRLNLVLDSIPMQLAKENKKYIYGQVREGARAKEIDFILQGKTSVVPVEVKAEENLRAKSLKAFCEKYHPEHAIRTSMSDYREQDWMTNLPLYDIGGIQKFLDD